MSLRIEHPLVQRYRILVNEHEVKVLEPVNITYKEKKISQNVSPRGLARILGRSPLGTA